MQNSRCMTFHTRGADFRAVFVSVADAVNAATQQIAVDEKVLYHFSELVICTNLLAGLFRETHDVTLEIETEKYFERFVVEASAHGIFRGACRTSEILQTVGSSKEIDNDLFGGILRVTKRYADSVEPVQGTIGSTSHSIPNLVQQYLHESEQIGTLMLTGVKMRRSEAGRLEAAQCFGLLIEALPDVSEEKKFIITDNLERLESLTEYFEGSTAPQAGVEASEPVKDVMDLLDDIYPGEQWIESGERTLVYRCQCHRAGYLEKMVQLARQNIEELFGDLDVIEVCCGYCTRRFHFSRKEIIEEL